MIKIAIFFQLEGENIMKILHTADWHLGIDLHKVSMIEDQKDAIFQLKQVVLDENIDVILIAGDIYDTVLASKEAIELYNMCMKMLCLELHKEVIIVAGNHDSAVRLATCSDLLSFVGLHIYGTLEQKIKGLQIKDVIFYPIPYLHPQIVNNVYGSKITTQEEAFQVICKEIKKEMDSSYHHVMIAHAFVAGGSLCESDRFASIGGSDVVSTKVFDGFDYVALGHLHRKQQVGEHVFYSGSLLPYSFSEVNHDKCFMIYDTDENMVYTKKIKPLHKLHILKGTFDEIQEQMKENNYQDDYIKIQIEDTSVSSEMLDYFSKHCKGLLQLVGKNEQLESSISLGMEDLEKIDDVSIVQQFFKDMYQEEVSEENIKLFECALASLEEDI